MVYNLLESLILKRWRDKNLLVVQSDSNDKRDASRETFKHKDTLKKAGFKWNNAIMSWTIEDDKFEVAKSTINGINGNKLLNMAEDFIDFIETNVNDKPSEKDQLMDKVKSYMDKLADEIDDPEMQQEYLKYLKFKSKFWKYSMWNQFFIYLSRPDATHVASYRTWRQKFNRQVVKGAKGIAILVPITYNKKVKVGNDEEQDALTDTSLDKEIGQKTTKALTFKIGYVFDISDTQPIEGKEEVEIADLNWRGSGESSEKGDEIYKKLSEFIEDYGIPVQEAPSRRGEDGWTDGKIISINQEATGERKLRVLVHEFAHYILHFDTSLFKELYDELKDKLHMDDFDFFSNKSKIFKENHADGITYLVLTHYGFETKYNINYLLAWKSKKDIIKLNEKILSTGAQFIIKGIEQQ